MHFQFANVLIFFALGFGLCGLMLGLGQLLRPSNPNLGKLSTYECGEPPSGPAWINFNIRFYLIALVFVIFDVELAFVYPVVAVFRKWNDDGHGLFALVEIGLFLWPGATRGMRMTVGGILIELVGSAAILGAAGKCPACGAGFGMEHKGLLPPRCRRCGAGLA